MDFHLSKSKFVSNCVHCNKYTWLEKYKPDEKAEVSEFTQSLFDNGHKVGELAKEYLNASVDVTAVDENGRLDLAKMLENTDKQIKLGTKAIAEASFSFGGLFCSVDILVRNDDGSYNIYEVKSSKPEKPTKKNPDGVKEKYKLDAAYQQYILKSCGLKVNEVYIVLLNRDYIRSDEFEIDKYFTQCNVTNETTALEPFVKDKLSEIGGVLSDENEPATVLSKGCNGCDFWKYCSGNIKSPSPFDIYCLRFDEKCKLYNAGVSFYDVPKYKGGLSEFAKLQIEYHNRPNDIYINKDKIKNFLDNLSFPLYSLDFETYQSVFPEYEGMGIGGQVPFQYSLHIIKKANPDISEGSADIEEHNFLDLSGADTRRAIAESLVKDIPYGANVMAYNESTERNIIRRLAESYSDLADHLLSYNYFDPLKIFREGSYYTAAMGKSCSLKSIAPALYPYDKDMDYHNLEGNIKNGSQAMNVFFKVREFSEEEKLQTEQDLKKYCALDTFAVVKIIKKLYEVAGD